jgi:EAL domain-containing protein (putative c-di-GMP-specific phosphodiesterase class I)
VLSPGTSTTERPQAVATRSSRDHCDKERFELFDHIIDKGLINPVFQPIVDATDHSVVGYEALARGPHNSVFEAPMELFSVAAQLDRTQELDQLCQARAIESALAAGLGNQLALFVNLEPSIEQLTVSDRLAAALDAASRHLRLVVEVSERSIFDHPASLIRMATNIRDRGWGLALGDVGVNPESLALLPFLDPDIVKLDRSIIADVPTVDTGRTLSAALDHTRRSGALLLAEGIETGYELERAMALRAQLLQGFRFGRGQALPPVIPRGVHPFATRRSTFERSEDTPFDLIEATLPVSIGRKDLLLAVTHDLERQAESLADAPILLAVFQDGFRFGPCTRGRYEAIRDNASFVGVLGTGMGNEPARGVRAGNLDQTDPLCDEWTVAVLSPHFAGALIARDLGDTGPDMQRRFAFAVTHDREIVIETARILAARLD